MKIGKTTTVIFFAIQMLMSNCGTQTDNAFSQQVDQLISKIESGEYANVHGTIIWKDGEIIGEKYWESWNGDRPHMLQSATKSITGILIGIAIKEKFIENEKVRVVDIFPEYRSKWKNDEHKLSLSIEDLMTMRTGMDWKEYPYNESHLAQMNNERNEWTKFVLDMPMKEVPGQNYAYNSGGTILLAGILQKVSGMSVQDFAHQYLFNPLNIISAEWFFADRQGLPHTGGGLRMSARDMLKIGQLVLQRGEWNGNKILDRKFVDKLFMNYLDKSLPQMHGYSRGYSLLWHVFPFNSEDVTQSDDNFIAAWGAHGQWIMVIPQHNMVAVFIAGTNTFQEETQFITIVYEDLLNESQDKN